MPNPEHERSSRYVPFDSFESFLGDDLQTILEALHSGRTHYQKTTQDPKEHTTFGTKSLTMYWNEQILRAMPGRFDMTPVNATILGWDEKAEQTSLVLMINNIVIVSTRRLEVKTSALQKMMQEKGIRDQEQLKGHPVTAYVVNGRDLVAIS